MDFTYNIRTLYTTYLLRQTNYLSFALIKTRLFRVKQILTVPIIFVRYYNWFITGRIHNFAVESIKINTGHNLYIYIYV